MLEVLIIDDETLARERVKHMLKEYDDISIVGECTHGLEAYNFLQTYSPDLIFLDIQMPEMTGLELVELLGVQNLPAIIFVTAYDQHAIKAFEYCAVDYLLKPFEKKRFAQAITQAKIRLQTKNNSDEKHNLKELIESTKPEIVERIFIKDSGFIKIVEISAIDYIESSGNYVTIHSQKKSYLHRQTMKKMEESLDSRKFVRVHRSYIVHISKIKSLTALSGGDYTIHLKDNSTVTLSRRYKENLEKYYTL